VTAPVDLLRAGRFKEARAILEQRNDPGSLIERARLALFLDSDVDATQRFAARVRTADDATAGQRALAAAFVRCTKALRGEHAPAVDAETLAEVEPPIIGEVIYYLAYAAYLARDLRSAEAWLRFHTPLSADWAARYLVISGMIAAGHERFVEQAELTARALDLLETQAPDHVYLIANAARHLAVLARDVPQVDASEGLERILDRLGDDDGFTGSRFHVVRLLGWSHALRGDYTGAMRFILRATFEADNDVERLYAHLDHASVAVFAHEQAGAAATAAFAIAKDLIATIPWHAIETDDLAALPIAAQVAVEFGASAEAISYCDVAEGGRGRISPRLPMAHDGRYDAMLSEAVSLAYASLDRRRALAAATSAYGYYERIGFAWRAARMAILLYQMTHRTEWKTRALSQLEAYPRSPFHRLLERPRALTKRQEDVLKLVRLGYDDERIARELGISYKTVRIHIGRIFQWYGVRSRSALMARVAAAGFVSA
jgi:DNA-binding CsgD family transcriptional regulator